jgi:hypothetical protein
MESSPALAVWSEILLPPLGTALLVVVFGLVTRRASPLRSLGRFRWRFIAVIAIAQLVLFLGAFLVSFGFGDAGGHVPWPLTAATLVLGFPLVYLLYLVPIVGVTRSVLGDGVLVLAAIASLNAIIWGLTVDRLTNRSRRVV